MWICLRRQVRRAGGLPVRLLTGISPIGLSASRRRLAPPDQTAKQCLQFCSIGIMLTDNEIGGAGENEPQGVHAAGVTSSLEPIPFEHRLLTKRELAQYFQITERTVEVWMSRRYIPFIKIGQSVRFRIATVLRYVDDKYTIRANEHRRRGGSA
jgi:excisionase family DNA binding protein